MIPVLVIGSDGRESINLAVARYISFMSNKGISLQRMRAACNAIGLLLEFLSVVRARQLVRPEDLPRAVASFMRARRTGQIWRDDGSTEHLGWVPVQRETVRQDRFLIAEFSEFCIDQLGYSAFREEQGQEVKGITPGEIHALRRLARLNAATRQTNLLHHISHRRRPEAFWPADIQERRTPQGIGSRPKRFVFFDEIRRLIDGTSSLMQKMLLIEAYFGGPRLSEMLHQWRCDVLPGSQRHHLFPDDSPSNLPLVLLAHPSQSRYVGPLSDSRVDRLQHLKSKYGLLPRTYLQGQPFHAGWKGMQFDNQSLGISQIFWANHEYAVFYEELFRDIRRKIYYNIDPEVLASHPYLYVNDAIGKPEFGRPLKISNARKVFERACRRLGTDPLLRDGSHGARHSYTALIDKLVENAPDVQKCLHHSHVTSQYSYAKEASRVGNKLRQLIAN